MVDVVMGTRMVKSVRRQLHKLIEANHAPTIDRFVKELSDADAYDFAYDWAIWARANQLWPAGKWQTWLILAGRGFGKTRTGAETVRTLVERGHYGRIGLIAEDAGDARDVMIEGESGIILCSDPRFMPKYEPSKRRLTWPNGAVATLYADADPEALRGPQHDLLWADELAKYPNQQDTWDNAMFGLRLGQDPRALVTTTPKPTKLIRELIRDEGTVITKGSTYENAQNLAPTFLQKIIKKYEGTRLGRQELMAEVLDDMPGALWTYAMIERGRIRHVNRDMLTRIVVGVDPSASEEGAEAGIIVSGTDKNDEYYVLEDATVRGRPRDWALAAVQAYSRWNADHIIAESNNGGLMVEETIRNVDANAPVKLVTASRGKITRAEPISALYEQGRVHHVGTFPDLEDQMTTYDPLTAKVSPDRMDGLVWSIAELSSAGEVSMDGAEMDVNMLSSMDFPA